jgi:hypothetical protein
MNIVMIVLRLIHIFAGVFWAGSVFFMISYLTPAVKATGAEGGKVMQRLLISGVTRGLVSAGALAALSGLTMYWLDSGGLQLVWITTPTGLGFSFGAIMGLVSLGVGLSVTKPAGDGIEAIIKGSIASGKPPSPEQMTQLQALQMKMATGSLWNAILLALALAAMATARYW